MVHLVPDQVFIAYFLCELKKRNIKKIDVRYIGTFIIIANHFLPRKSGDIYVYIGDVNSIENFFKRDSNIGFIKKEILYINHNITTNNIKDRFLKKVNPIIIHSFEKAMEYMDM